MNGKMNCAENAEKAQDIVPEKTAMKKTIFFRIFSRNPVDRKAFLRYNPECASIRA